MNGKNAVQVSSFLLHEYAFNLFKSFVKMKTAEDLSKCCH